jgi:uncharacterized protein YlxP (DUF503 family)
VAVAEIGTENSYNWLRLEILTLANRRDRVEAVLNKAKVMVESTTAEEITTINTEVFGV